MGKRVKGEEKDGSEAAKISKHILSVSLLLNYLPFPLFPFDPFPQEWL